MRRYTLRFVMTMVLLASLLGTTSGSSIPNAFYGDVLIGDQKAPDSTVVSAEINGVEYVNTMISGGQYNFNVPSDDPATPQKEGGVDGETVVFYVNAVQAGEHSFEIGGITEMPLSIAEEETPQPARIVKTPEPVTSVASPDSPPAAPPQVTPVRTPDEATIMPSVANETHTKIGQSNEGQDKDTTYNKAYLLIIAAAMIIILLYFMRIRKIK